MSDDITVKLAPLEIRPTSRKPSLLEMIITALWPYLIFGAGMLVGWGLRGME